MKRSVILATATLAVSLFALPMFATTTVSSVGTNNVTATVVGSCKWSTPLAMTFGPYDPFAVAATTQSTSVNFRCVKQTNGTDTYKVWFNKPGGTMSGGLIYTLTDSLGAGVKTSAGSAATIVGGASGLAGGYTYVVNGSIAPGQDVPAGANTDSVTSNIEY
jgi:hypothetical protein